MRDHTHALRELKRYLGDDPPPPYQPSAGQRTCGLIGTGALSPAASTSVSSFVEQRGYRAIHLDAIPFVNPLEFDPCEHLACLDVAVSCVDMPSASSHFWRGAVHAVGLPAIAFTTGATPSYSDRFPAEFQPRQAHASADVLSEVLSREFDLFEQQFLSAEDPAMIERYTRMQVEAGRLQGRYEDSTRQRIAEVVMGDKYEISGQAGAVGRYAEAHHMSFTQQWDRMSGTTNLAELTQELRRLRETMEREATEPAHKLALGAVAAAEQSASRNNGPEVLQYLKAGGTWALNVAEKIGVALATSALKQVLGV